MSKPTFYINKCGAQNKSETFDNILTNEILSDISKRLFNASDYEVKFCEERIKGRLIYCICNNKKIYIALSPNGKIKGRNSYFQSLPTAINIYVKDLQKKDNSKKDFYYYFLPSSGNNETDYHNFFYRLIVTCGIKILNLDFGLKTFPKPFASVQDLILNRNSLKKSNNNSTYITDEGKYYHIYGKTFGANQKETTFICIAISLISDKPVKLFQIRDNNTEKLSATDIETINYYSTLEKSKTIEILDDSYNFDDDPSDAIKDNLRSPKFIYNLLSKFENGKKCTLCHCKINCIIQAAHIYPVAAIRKRTDLSMQERIDYAIDKDNGIWLCENHHKLFDKNLIKFTNGKISIDDKLDTENKEYINQISTIKEIETKYINQKLLNFFNLRYSNT